MTRTSAYFAAVTADHMTPISCSHCAANAHLVQRLPAITGDGKGELHVTGVTGRTFALIARSRSTTSFTITRGANGRLLHGCSRPGHGGCRPDGRW